MSPAQPTEFFAMASDRIFHFDRTRLAPSPTGALHLGHARTFLITWCLARQAKAEIIMRMEDLDAARAKPESVKQAYDDLHWLGMDWDEGPFSGRPTGDAGGCAEYVQSNRRPLYATTLELLAKIGAIYPCVCTRADIAEAVAASVAAPHEGDVQARYPGTCRGKYKGVEEAQSQTGKPACWRLRVPEGVVTFDDGIVGPQSLDVAADAGDFPLTRFDGTPAYQLACVVDDAAMAIDCVIRGDDLLASTPRQILLYRAMGLLPPLFAHVPLVIGPDGKRLAKRHGESRIAQFREAGVPPEKIVGWVAWRSGQIDAPQAMTAKDLAELFDLRKLPRERIVLNADDLAWLRA
jgi:glutamyl-tRNA synthetase